ncbi:ATP-binding cassette domain-containing protein [bacterium]|nr:ATP-binding cassette domain-containing protein [bacterium]
MPESRDNDLDSIIVAKRLTKTFYGKTAVDRVSFSVKKGEILGFLGPNGAGKTTTMKMLTCFYPPTSGTATVNGFDILKDSESVRASLGFMPENVPLYADLKVSEFLYFVAKAKGMAAIDIKPAVASALERCNLLDVSEQLISTISRGYRQRVGLAQAIINNPPILILDEPSVGLDPAQIKDFRDLILSLAKNSTVILSTHILPEVSLMCDRVCIIDKGAIVAMDTPSNLSDRLERTKALKLEVLAQTSEAVMTELKKLTDVISIENLGGQRLAGYDLPLLSYKIEYPRENISVRHSITALIAEKKWEIYGLYEDKLSLEDVFLHLVNKEKEVDLTKNEASESAAEAPAEEAGAAEKVDLSKEAEAGEADKQDLSADSESDDKDQEKV